MTSRERSDTASTLSNARAKEAFAGPFNPTEGADA